MVDESFKILGAVDDPDRVGVRGRNDATSGTPVGVEGIAPASGGLGLYTGDDAAVDGSLSVSSVTTDRLSVAGGTDGPVVTADDDGSVLVVDFDSGSESTHALELRDRVEGNTEQLSIRGDATGSSEIVFQDLAASNYKWGLRAAGTNDFFIDNHADLTSRVQFVKRGPTRFRNRKTIFQGAPDGTAAAVRDGDLDLGGEKLRNAGKDVTTVGADTTLDTAVRDLVLVDTGGGGVTVTLPTEAPEGASLTIKAVGPNTVTIDPSEGAIDGATGDRSLTTEGASLVLTADGGGDWWIEARYDGSA